MSDALTDEDYEDIHTRTQEFVREFAMLVRKFVPTLPEGNSREAQIADDLLRSMQDCTSCYQPYVWSDEFSKKVSDG